MVLAYGDRIALRASDFEIPEGRVTAVIGPNGSGKSTLFRAVAGLKDPTWGRLEVLGSSPRSMRRRVAYVLQATSVNQAMPVTVGELVTMGRYAGVGLLGRLSRADRAAVAQALERLEIAHLADRHLGDLSAGQRQRVFVAQGLVQDRDLFLLDEPITGLDLVSSERIIDVIAEERGRGGTVALTTHDLSEAALADHVLLLAGRLVAAGPPERVLAPSHLSEAYGARVFEVDGRLMVDDAAHDAATSRHVHLDRSARLPSPPGSR